MPDEGVRAGGSSRPFDVVALAASAGGVEALSSVLKALPADLPVAVLILQHLRQRRSELDELFARQTQLPVAWAEEGCELLPGHVYMCPPQHSLELHPDRTCSLIPLRSSLHPIDATLESLADSYRARAAVAILTGMGTDGAAGVTAVKRLGGTVFAQSEDSAEQPRMPRSAIATGAVDLVLPLSELPRALIALLSRGVLPRSRAELAALDALFGGPGIVRRLLRRVDWAESSLGPVETWPSILISSVHTMLEVKVPAAMFLGPEHVCIYNDAYIEVLGRLHPAAVGKPAAVIWADAWPRMRSLLERSDETGEATRRADAQWLINRFGYTEETYFELSISRVRDHDQRRLGFLSLALDTTEYVVGQRRAALLSGLASAPPSEAHRHLVSALASDPHDLPFALVYELDPSKTRATLTARVAVPQDAFMASPVLDFAGARPIWPIDAVVASRTQLIVSDLHSRFGDAVPGPWTQAPHEALLLPLCVASEDEISGVLIAGISAARRLDEAYRAFLERVAKQVAASLVLARARADEKRRAQALAEADRVKTEFFSNVSHEFRTPLTLAIAPLQRLLDSSGLLSPGIAAELELAHRNARRLLTLVNQLLDFTRAEASRLDPKFEDVDLAQEVESLSSLFRSAIERAGIRLRVDCQRLSAPVRIDRNMWEMIVSNLLANALKFTFEGEICVELRERAQHAELVVRDTGVGIPPGELPNLFTRFHRVSGARARSEEGSGIGLALARQLVRLHGGRIRVRSESGRGATFTVWLPMLRSGASGATAGARAMPAAKALAETALSWIESKPLGAPLVTERCEDDESFLSRTTGSRVLVVDDNADMRAYLERLLEQPGWQVTTAQDGASALELLPKLRPDLVLTDVMMPNVDGFELLRRIRADALLQTTPVILLTARAGEAAAVEGLVAGADDHITKPFTARELIVRVGAQLELSRVRGRIAKRDAFRVELATAVRALSDPNAIQSAACRVLAHWLGATRAYYFDVLEHGKYVRVNRDHCVDSHSIAGDWRAEDFGPVMPAICGGRPFILRDAARDARVEGRRQTEPSPLATRSLIAVPIVVAAEAVAGLAVGSDQLRDWTNDEVELVQETAERTSEAVIRCRAEAATALALARSEVLRELAERAAPDTATQTLYDEVMRAAIALGRADAGTVQILEPETRELVLLATSGFGPEMTGHYQRVDAASGSACGRALASGLRTFVDFQETPDDPDARRHSAAGYRCALSMPLVTRDGDAIGMVSIHWAELHRPDDELVRYLGLLARQAADLVERQRTRELLRVEREENARLRALLASRAR